MASWQPVLILSNIVTSQTGQGLYATYDKDNREASEAKSDDTQQICV